MDIMDTIGEFRPAYTEEQLNGSLSICHACPVLYRFMRDEQIDEFLNTGRLRISTIPSCRTLKDKKRSDESESFYQYELKWADITTDVNARVGENAFVLCFSLTQSACHDSSCASCLEIHHWQPLVLEIGEQLRQQGYPIAEIFTGPCNYAAKVRSIDMRPMEYKEITTANNKVIPEKLSSLLVRFGREAFYMTKDFRFAEEHEYRFLWLSNMPVKPTFVTIQNPERFGCKVSAIGSTYESN